jgi:hypothetical protein
MTIDKLKIFLQKRVDYWEDEQEKVNKSRDSRDWDCSDWEYSGEVEGMKTAFDQVLGYLAERYQ